MCRGVRVRVKAEIAAVTVSEEGVRVKMRDESVLKYDKVIFACDAISAKEMLLEGDAKMSTILQRLMNIYYVDDDGVKDGAAFLDGTIHDDVNVLSETAREKVSKISNYISVDKSTKRYNNTFVCSCSYSQFCIYSCCPLLHIF